MRHILKGAVTGVLLVASPAFADMGLYTTSGQCWDLNGTVSLGIHVDHGEAGRHSTASQYVDLPCGSYASETVYADSDVYCTVTSHGCPSGTGSVYCYKGSESAGTGFSFGCP